MTARVAKYAIDANKVRWTLLEGVITRKTYHAGPTGGQQLPVRNITALEERKVEKVSRPALAVPAAVLGAVLGAIAWGLGSILLGVAGLVCFCWGAVRLPGKKTLLDARQIVAPGMKPEDWIVVGDGREVIGFIEGLKIEISERASETALEDTATK